MSNIILNYRQNVLRELHAAWMENPNSEMPETIERVKAVMERHKLKFLNGSAIDASLFLLDITKIGECFFERVNSPKYNDPGWFSWLCESYMDFEPVTKVINDQLFSEHFDRTFNVVAIAERFEGLTIVSPPKPAA